MNPLPEKILFRLEARALTNNTPLKDLQISHNSIIVRKWPGKVEFTNGTCVKEFEIQAYPWENKITASVYAEDGIRSKEAVWDRPMQGYGYGVVALKQFRP